MESTPEYMNPSAALAEMQIHNAATDAAAKLREKASTLNRGLPSGFRTFISPQYPNGKFLAVPGRVIMAPFQSAMIGLQPAVSRDGDIWVRFNSGVITTEDPQEIAFLEAHSGDPEDHADYHRAQGRDPRTCSVPIGLCREQGEGVDVWAELKMGQVPTARRPATISPEIDIDAFMRGDYKQGNKSKLTKGIGAQIQDTVEANENAAEERADGQRNDHI